LNRVGELSALHLFYPGLDRSRVQEIALDDFGTKSSEFIRPGIEFVDKCVNRKALRKQKRCDRASG
jgi:hypothetical protein